ncbi:hypothetical protein [Streptomyces collinus]|uniref:Uncharacterized protein n=1 Tax=Streptomyces collinus (strain DSM 40733 / Tue 365) TaxID=1214242 RepID=S5VFV7_STRC3|nr:hypothetical protein [Streptomyces collinus]AGS69417.1 hypothetical protein B446_12995 [Streptomyces collinus Tu 365]UJA08057.1 hypothetical protein HGI10_19620 [Streptomyces collinus]UJA17078.1 hypothetical protein HGI09_44490 [Streptomyces collinus]
MTGLKLCATLLATGRIFGVGIDSSVSEVDQALRGEYIEELGDSGVDARRDYGWIEISLTKREQWVLVGATLELHRLSENADLIRDVLSESGVAFEGYTPWLELKEQFLSSAPDSSLQCTQQGDYMEYRNPDVKVSVFVVNDDTERDEWPGHGDVWSIALG